MARNRARFCVVGLVELATTVMVLRIAGLAPERLVVSDRFTETVARNRGADLLVTTNMDQARKWPGI